MAIQWETQTDRDNEEAVARRYATIMNCQYRKLHKGLKADYAFLRDDKVVALVEVKCRKVASLQYPTIMLSVHKWIDMLNMAERMNVPAMFVVRFTDTILALNLSTAPECIEVGGRGAIRDERDHDLVAFFDIAKMRPIER